MSKMLSLDLEEHGMDWGEAFEDDLIHHENGDGEGMETVEAEDDDDVMVIEDVLGLMELEQF